jgi:large subunit ribosomal protein L25
MDSELKVSSRSVTGKKVKVLRRQGITPLHLYGHGVKSEALQCETVELRRLLAQTGRTALIGLHIDEEKRPMNVLVREVQREPVSGELLHVDFFQVRMAEKIKMEVPLVLVGEAPALKQKENMLEHELNSLAIECLPGAIPAQFEVDVSALTEAEQVIRVKDIPLDKEVTLLSDPERMIVKIISRPMEKEEVVVAEEEAVVGAEAAEAPEAVTGEGASKEE